MSILKTDFSTITPGLLNAFPGAVKRAIEIEKQQSHDSAYIAEINAACGTDFTTMDECMQYQRVMFPEKRDFKKEVENLAQAAKYLSK